VYFTRSVSCCEMIKHLILVATDCKIRVQHLNSHTPSIAGKYVPGFNKLNSLVSLYEHILFTLSS